MTCSQYLAKGWRVLVVGGLEEPFVWTDDTGNTRTSLQVRARRVQFLSARAETDALSVGQSAYESGRRAPGPESNGAEDIPF